MRLTCPNCGARYEVADDMIPASGRDVQCSNCATTWFQPGRRPPAPESGPTPTEPAADAAPERPPEAPEPEPEQETVPQAETEPETEGSDEAATGTQERPARREIDPAVREILQQEAERESRLRRAEADPVETQSEMPLDEEPADRHRARRRAELDEAEDVFAAGAATGAGAARGDAARRDLLPDIEEINSTLRATGDRQEGEEDASDIDTLDAPMRRRRGARSGFLLIIAIAAFAVAIYANSGRIAALVPQASPYLDQYVAWVNEQRLWLDGIARGLLGGEPSDNGG